MSLLKSKRHLSIHQKYGINKSFMCDINTINFNLANEIKIYGTLKLQGDVIQLLKSKKNKTEQNGMLNSLKMVHH